jgi:hypothetical protein
MTFTQVKKKQEKILGKYSFMTINAKPEVYLFPFLVNMLKKFLPLGSTSIKTEPISIVNVPLVLYKNIWLQSKSSNFLTLCNISKPNCQVSFSLFYSFFVVLRFKLRPHIC